MPLPRQNHSQCQEIVSLTVRSTTDGFDKSIVVEEGAHGERKGGERESGRMALEDVGGRQSPVRSTIMLSLPPVTRGCMCHSSRSGASNHSGERRSTERTVNDGASTQLAMQTGMHVSQ
eukprot:SAG25_NODE_708_length_5832_cov_2.856794_2_plen_119_part_00